MTKFQPQTFHRHICESINLISINSWLVLVIVLFLTQLIFTIKIESLAKLTPVLITFISELIFN